MSKVLNRDEILKKEMEIAESIYGTQNDPEQMPINKESVAKLDELYSDWLETELDENGEPVSWSVILPTQKDLAEKFMSNQITEKDLLYLTKKENFYDALYIVSVITIPEKRNMGFAKKILEKSISKVPLTKNALIFAWPITNDGFKFINKIKTNVKIKS